MERSLDSHKIGRKHYFRRYIKFAFPVMSFALILAGFAVMLSPRQPAQAAPGDWSTYLSDNARSNYNGSETVINASSAPNLKQHWSYQAGGYISTNNVSVEPVEANGMIYWGSWDGNMHATNLSGQQVWQHGLGYNYSAQCSTLTGIASSATVASVTIGTTLTPVVFVGGGDGNLYALNANDGSFIWHTRLGSPPNNFIWGSPAVYNGYVYIGLSSFGDCPLVRGKVISLNASTGAIQHIFNTVPAGCVGGSVWGSPTINESTGILYVATGNEGSCSTTETLTDALIALRTPNLSLVGSWQIPSLVGMDSDFGSTPTLFQATIGGKVRQLVGIANKNGVYYAFNRGSLSSGPIWTAQVAGQGGGCGPECGDGSISPSAWDGTTLYVAGGQTSVGGNSCKGSLRALNPATGQYKWEDCFNDGPVLGAVSVVPGVAIIGEGNKLVLVATSDGHTLYSYTDTNSGSNFYSGASVSNGTLYIGNYNGFIYAFGL